MSIKSIDIDGIEALEFDPIGRAPIFFDIETGPDGQSACAQMPDFHAPSNWKDPDKIAANLAKQEESWWEKLALDPMTGEIVAFGFRYKGQSYSVSTSANVKRDDGVAVEVEDLEQVLLMGVDRLIAKAGARSWVGHNIYDFDLPFIVRRLWRYGMKMPAGWRQGNWWNNWLIDTQKLFSLGKFKDFVSLDKLALHLGHPKGKDGKSGAGFHELLADNEEEALAYLDADLQLTEYCYERIKH
jgi:hypothetical protein